MTRVVLCLALALALPTVASAGFQILTVGKLAGFRTALDPAKSGGSVRVGRDRALATLHDPRCPATSRVQVESYVQATFRDVLNVNAKLDCTKWTAIPGGWRYVDPAGPVRRIRYASDGLRIDVGGVGFRPIAGPVGFLQGQLAIGDTTLRARFHEFARNDGRKVLARRPSAAAAAGEAAFWGVLTGDDDTDARETEAIALLERAAASSRHDGRSRFLLGMIHLYRFGQMVGSFGDVSDAAKAEIVAGSEWFEQAVPLLWDGTRGDSRVPGFAAAAKWTRGYVQGDAATRAAGLADLAKAVQANAFFNVFDYIPVIAAVPASSPEFHDAFVATTTYLNAPDTLPCVTTQPEICANAGMAPHNLQGSLLLFGDIYAKAGDLDSAQQWYGLANLLGAGYPFADVLADRVANAAARVALYQDADPTNDPPVIGAGREACAACHRR